MPCTQLLYVPSTIRAAALAVFQPVGLAQARESCRCLGFRFAV